MDQQPNETPVTPEIVPDANPDITSDDKLWGALSYIWLIGLIMLLIEEKKNRPFIRFHAVQSMALNVVLVIASIIIGWIPFVQCLTPLIWLVLLWPAIGAFQGKLTNLPFISDFIRKQGWV